jgi:hypothetical protein
MSQHRGDAPAGLALQMLHRLLRIVVAMLQARCSSCVPKQNENNRNCQETPGWLAACTIASMSSTHQQHQKSLPGLCRRSGFLSRDIQRGQVPTPGIVSITGTVSLRLGSFSLSDTRVQFNPSMSRSRKATHRTPVRRPHGPSLRFVCLGRFSPLFKGFSS